MMAAQTKPGIQNVDERGVLSRYATGANVADIQSPHGRDWVSKVLLDVCGMDRGRARAAVIAYDAAMSRPNGRKESAPPASLAVLAKGKASKASKPAFVEPAAPPAPKPAPEPQPKPARPAEPEAAKPEPNIFALPDRAEPPPQHGFDVDVEAVLAAAETSGVPRIEAKAAAVRKLIDELAGLISASEEERELRDTIKRLSDERDAAVARLNELTGDGTALNAGLPDAEEQKAIRVWAAEQGITCNTHGRIPKRVIDAWRHRGGVS